MKLTEHVWAIPDFNVGLVPNVGIIVGSKATLVVDTGLGPRNGEAIVPRDEEGERERRRARRPDALPPRALARRRGVQGRQAADDAHAAAGHDGARQADSGHVRRPLGGHRGAAERRPYPTPDILFDRDYRLDLGGVHARLLWRGPSAMHTRGDTMIFVEEDRVLFTGDVVMSQRFLAAQNTSSITTWLSTLDELASLAPAKVVPSHGSIGDATLIARDRAFLQAVQARVGELKRAGKVERRSRRGAWWRTSRRNIPSGATRRARRLRRVPPTPKRVEL